jgi:hypothetical protein
VVVGCAHAVMLCPDPAAAQQAMCLHWLMPVLQAHLCCDGTTHVHSRSAKVFDSRSAYVLSPT